MTLQQNWRYQTLEKLENDHWGLVPKNESYLVTTMHELRHKQLNDFTIEDLRILIGQSMGLQFLIPLAIEALENDFFSEGHFYQGDLIQSVLTSDAQFWKSERDSWSRILQLCEDNKETKVNYDTTEEIKRRWMESYLVFSSIHQWVVPISN